MRDPFVAEVARAFRWYEAKQLDLKYPDGVPNVVMWGVDQWAGALSATQVHDMREERKRREAEAEARELVADARRPR